MNMLEICRMKNHRYYPFGDFNIQFQRYPTGPVAGGLINTLLANSFFALVNNPMRDFENSRSIIDNIFMNDTGILSE